MAWFDIFWTPEAEEHLARNGVTFEEFQEIITAARYSDIENSLSSDYLTVDGYTSTGRYLRCVFDKINDLTIYPVTAYEPTEE